MQEVECPECGSWERLYPGAPPASLAAHNRPGLVLGCDRLNYEIQGCLGSSLSVTKIEGDRAYFAAYFVKPARVRLR